MLQGQLRGEPEGLLVLCLLARAQSVAVFPTGACCSPAEVRGILIQSGEDYATLPKPSPEQAG